MARINERHGGRRPGAGRKSKAEELGIVANWDKWLPLSAREKVVKSLYKESLGGNVQAAALLLAYCYGKPTEKHEHSGADGDAIEIVITHVKTGIKAD